MDHSETSTRISVVDKMQFNSNHQVLHPMGQSVVPGHISNSYNHNVDLPVYPDSSSHRMQCCLCHSRHSSSQDLHRHYVQYHSPHELSLALLQQQCLPSAPATQPSGVTMTPAQNGHQTTSSAEGGLLGRPRRDWSSVGAATAPSFPDSQSRHQENVFAVQRDSLNEEEYHRDLARLPLAEAVDTPSRDFDASLGHCTGSLGGLAKCPQKPTTQKIMSQMMGIAGEDGDDWPDLGDDITLIDDEDLLSSLDLFPNLLDFVIELDAKEESGALTVQKPDLHHCPQKHLGYPGQHGTCQGVGLHQHTIQTPGQHGTCQGVGLHQHTIQTPGQHETCQGVGLHQHTIQTPGQHGICQGVGLHQHTIQTPDKRIDALQGKSIHECGSHSSFCSHDSVPLTHPFALSSKHLHNALRAKTMCVESSFDATRRDVSNNALLESVISDQVAYQQLVSNETDTSSHVMVDNHNSFIDANSNTYGLLQQNISNEGLPLSNESVNIVVSGTGVERRPVIDQNSLSVSPGLSFNYNDPRSSALIVNCGTSVAANIMSENTVINQQLTQKHFLVNESVSANPKELSPSSQTHDLLHSVMHVPGSIQKTMIDCTEPHNVNETIIDCAEPHDVNEQTMIDCAEPHDVNEQTMIDCAEPHDVNEQTMIDCTEPHDVNEQTMIDCTEPHDVNKQRLPSFSERVHFSGGQTLYRVAPRLITTQAPTQKQNLNVNVTAQDHSSPVKFDTAGPTYLSIETSIPSSASVPHVSNSLKSDNSTRNIPSSISPKMKQRVSKFSRNLKRRRSQVQRAMPQNQFEESTCSLGNSLVCLCHPAGSDKTKLVKTSSGRVVKCKQSNEFIYEKSEMDVFCDARLGVSCKVSMNKYNPVRSEKITKAMMGTIEMSNTTSHSASELTEKSTHLYSCASVVTIPVYTDPDMDLVHAPELVDKGGCHTIHSQPSKSNSSFSKPASRIKNERRQQFLCHLCWEQFPALSVLTVHLKADHAEWVPCFACRCGSTFASEDAFRTHWRVKHRDFFQVTYTCRICGEIFYRENAFNAHLRVIHPDYKVVCYVCEKRFVHMKSLRIHMAGHTKKQTFVCPYCPKTYFLRYSFNRHFVNHFSNPCCHPCNKHFKSKQSYDDHMRRHSVSTSLGRASTLKCNNCGDLHEESSISANRDSGLGHHRVCVSCNKGLYKMFSLANEPHELSNAAARVDTPAPESSLIRDRQECPQCQSWVLDLTKHVRRVHRQPTVVCEVCGALVKKECLPAHKDRAHAGLGGLPCDHCGKLFANALSLREHNNRVKNKIKSVLVDII